MNKVQETQSLTVLKPLWVPPGSRSYRDSWSLWVPSLLRAGMCVCVQWCRWERLESDAADWAGEHNPTKAGVRSGSGESLPLEHVMGLASLPGLRFTRLLLSL